MTRRIDHALNKQRRARRQPRKMTLRETFKMCPYRTLLGNARGGPDAMMARLGCTVAVLDGDPEPMSQRMMRDVLRELAAGRTVLLISNKRELRDFAKREIMAMAGPAGGAA